jgi:hypothetical protein
MLATKVLESLGKLGPWRRTDLAASNAGIAVLMLLAIAVPPLPFSTGCAC